MQFSYLIFVLNWHCIAGSDENYASQTVPSFLNFTSSLLMLLFVQPLSGNSAINYQTM